MFKSITFKRYDSKTNKFLYELEDSEFGNVEVEIWAGVAVEIGAGDMARAVVGIKLAREYSKRGLDVGKNLAIAVMWYYEVCGYTVKDTCKWQDKYCTEHIPNWKEYAQSRDEHLANLLLLG